MIKFGTPAQTLLHSYLYISSISGYSIRKSVRHISNSVYALVILTFVLFYYLVPAPGFPFSPLGSHAPGFSFLHLGQQPSKPYLCILLLASSPSICIFLESIGVVIFLVPQH